jgi:FkbM family methyltransferase
MIRKLYDFIERKLLIGRLGYQPFYESLHRISLRGMNYGQNDSSETNGERWVMNYIKDLNAKIKKNNLVIFDVGANKGQYVSSLITIFPKSKIYCFEPSPAAFTLLQEKISTQTNIQTFQLGLGNRQEKLSLQYDLDGSVTASFKPMNETLKQVSVDVTTLDQFCEEKKIHEIDLLKIDVEGFELFVLQGAKRMISEKRIKRIQFEFGQNNITHGIYLKHFFDLLSNYTINRIVKNGIRKIPYSKEFEIILTTNYLAELRD